MEFFYETLLVEHHGSHVLSVSLNRPEAANAFNTQMARDLINLFEALALSDFNIRAIVLTGSGQRAFCAGGDLGAKWDDGYSLAGPTSGL